jgi:putative membrane protein
MILFIRLFICNAYAHGVHTTELIEKKLPFVVKWTWDPTLLFFILLGVLYVLGLLRLPSKNLVARWQKILFFSGIIILILTYLPPIDPISDQLFSMHMLQHMLIVAVGVPLLIFGAPFYVIMRGLPISLKHWIFFPYVRSVRFRNFLNILQRPLIAMLLYETTFWFWHIPKFYNLALLNDEIHLFEHACMAFAAIHLWRMIIDAPPLKSPLSMPLRILLLGLVMTLDMALSAALVYSNKVWYAYDQLPMPAWWFWNRLEDQQLGGLIMWIPGGLIWLSALIAIFFIWFKKEGNLNPPLELIR